MSKSNAAIAAYLRTWAGELDAEFDAAMSVYGPGFRHGRPAPDHEERLWQKRSQAAELRRRATVLDPPCVVCKVEGAHEDWCEPRWRFVAAQGAQKVRAS